MKEVNFAEVQKTNYENIDEEITEEEIKKYTNYFTGEVSNIYTSAFSRYLPYGLLLRFLLLFIIGAIGFLLTNFGFPIQLFQIVSIVVVVIFLALYIKWYNHFYRKEFAKVLLKRDRRIMELEKKLEDPRFFIWQPITDEELKKYMEEKMPIILYYRTYYRTMAKMLILKDRKIAELEKKLKELKEKEEMKLKKKNSSIEK